VSGLRAVLFDLGGVVMGSPLHAIADYEREIGAPAGFVNRLVVATGPGGAWSQLERGEVGLEHFYARFDAECREAGQPVVSARVMMERIGVSAQPRPRMLAAVGVDRVLTMDLHADQIQGFFDVPVDNIYAAPVLLGDVWKHNYDNLLVVSPDVGGVVRARALAKRLESDLAIIDKRRPRPNVSEVMNIIGEVEGRTCVIMDDMVDTANTLCRAADALKEQGALKVLAYCTHPVLSGSAVQRIQESALDEVVVTDSIPLRPDGQACRKIRVLSVAGLVAETILRISNEESVSSLFME